MATSLQQDPTPAHDPDVWLVMGTSCWLPTVLLVARPLLEAAEKAWTAFPTSATIFIGGGGGGAGLRSAGQRRNDESGPCMGSKKQACLSCML